MNPAFNALLLLLLTFSLVQPSIANDRRGDRDREGREEREDREGPRTKFENTREHYKYEYRDRNCRYKYEYNYRTGKTKVEERGDCRHIVVSRPPVRGEPLPRAIPPEPHARRIVCNREVLGSIIGGAIGARVGSKFGDRQDRAITTIGGAVIGAVIGGAIGRSMDEADQACAAQALEYANLNQAVAWDNATRGATYTVTPVELYRSEQGAECRRYIVRTVSGGRQQDSTGNACRRDDGSWAPVN